MTILGGMKLYLGMFLMKILCVAALSGALFFGYIAFFFIEGMLKKDFK